MKNTLLLFVSVILTYNCSTIPPYDKFPETASPREEISSLKDDLNEAQNRQVDILSPNNYEKSYDYFEKAQENIEDQKDPKESLRYIAISRAYLEISLASSQRAKQNLIQVIRAREAAVEANAQEYAKDDFESADRELISLAKKVEDDKVAEATKYSSELQERYLKIEMDSIKSANLDPAQTTIDQAIKEGAREYAPRSLALVQKEYKDFDSYLTANRHKDQEISAKYQSLQNKSQHLLKITRESKANQGMSSEDMALMNEDNLDAIAVKQYQIENDENQLQKLSAQNSKLQSSQKFNELFETARREFKNNEAEVYKQGDTLTIRLKGLNFPSSKAEIKNENYALLSKVQKVISSFEISNIVIEGHTDSQGGKKANEELSLERAESVKQYLVSNHKGKSLNIDAKGYDYQRPLASNRTAVGRAQNRRVDVKITPSQN